MTSRVCFWLVHALAFSISICILQPEALGQASVLGQWSTLSNTVSINPIHVALLSNGKLLVVAGSGNCPPSLAGCPSGPPYGPSNGSGALLLDPVSGQVISQYSLDWDMFCNGMVLLEDGRPFIAGGTITYDPFHGSPQTAIFDLLANTFSNTQNMAHGRWYPTLLTLGDGRVMTFSGLTETGATNTAVEFYSADSGWSAEYIAPWTPDMYPRLHLLPDGKVFYSGAQTTSKLFDTSTNTWNTNVATTNYSVTRTYGTSVLLPLTPANNYDPKVIIMGGGNPATDTTEIIDMGASTPAWQYGPNMSQPRIEMNAVILPNGQVLAVGGSINDEDTKTASLSADLYDPVSNTFSPAGANAYPRLYHSVALLLPDATVWLAGGNPSRGSYVPQMEIYKPGYLFNPDETLATRPSITSSPGAIGYGEAFTVTTPDAANISSVVLVRNGTVTHSFGMDQREVGLSFTAGSGRLTITSPPNSNIAPPGYYMLFLLNQSGVPSVAKFVQVTPTPPDFSLAASPSSQTVSQGKSTSYTTSVTPSNGFSGNVSFSVTGLPSGATAGFTPSSVSGSGSSTLTVNTSTSTSTGTYMLTITATSGALTHSTQVKLVEGAATLPGFSLAASPSSQSVSQGNSTSYTVSVTPSNGFSGTVSFRVTGLPSGATASFTPSSVSGSGSSTLTVNTLTSTPTGTYTLTIAATSGTLTHSTQVKLVSIAASLINVGSYYRIINQASGLCIDDGGNLNSGAPLMQGQCSAGDKNQEWWFSPSSTSGHYSIGNINASSSPVWTVSNGSVSNNTPVQQAAATQAKYQQWAPLLLSTGYYKFVDANSGLCLTVPGGAKTNGLQLQVSACNGTPSQSFVLGSISTSIVSGFWYGAINTTSGMCVTDPGSAVSNGTPLVQTTCGTLLNEEWQFQPTMNGYDAVRSGSATSLVWDDTNGSKVNGNAMQLWTWSDSGDQQWIPRLTSNGLWTFRNLTSGDCLDNAASTTSGTRMTQWSCSSVNRNQQFELDRVR